MLRYIIKRVLMLIPILLGVIIIVFTINYFTDGSPAIAILGGSATPENIAQVEHEWGLDRPYFVQLGEYLWNIVTKFDFGTSYVWERPVMEMIMERLGTTMLLGLLGVGVTVVIGIPLGLLAASKQYSVFDYASTTVAVVLASLPSFWLALMMILFFSVKLGVLPISGLGSPAHWILPVAAVGVFPLAIITRMTRSSMLDVIRQDYVRTARAKGLNERNVLYKHALPNAIIPVITAIGMTVGFAMTGTIIIETIFNIPGIGLLMSQAISSYDYNLTQGIVVVCALIISGCNLITDIIYAFIDPRIKAMYKGQRRSQKIRARDLIDEEYGEEEQHENSQKEI